jgi:hypothetical protein
MSNVLPISGVPGGRLIAPLNLLRLAAATALTVGYRNERAMRRFARASSIRNTAIFRSRLLVSASSTSRVSCSSWNSVQNRSAPGVALSFIAGKSMAGFDVSMLCAQAARRIAALIPSKRSGDCNIARFLLGSVPRS